MPQLAELRRSIEELAIKVVVGSSPELGGDGGWLTAFEKVREEARRGGAREVEAAAASAVESLAGAEQVPAELASAIARLQEAVDRDGAGAPPPEPLAQDPELLADFVLESREHLAAIEAQVLAIERDPQDSEALNAVFRGFHTIKGLAGFLELWEVQKLAHEVETVLDRARNSRLTITAAAIDVILESADFLRRWLVHVESGLKGERAEAPQVDELLLNKIRGLAEAGGATPAPAAEDLAALAEAVVSPKPAPDPVPAAAPAPERRSESSPAEAAAPVPAAGPRSEAMAVRVDTGKLDYLVDMAGEMVIAESLVRHDAELSALKSPRLQRKVAQLSRITAELQKTAMAMRLVPIGPLFRKMARLVRDLARQFGKAVELETQGDDIELDRTIVEELADPFMHMVRNALDHGIEPPEERQKSGKSSPARVLLKAQHQAGQVVIEIADDGRGLNAERIKAKAVEKGLISSAAGMSDDEAYNLIFLPGFSTAANVTNVSGRGVGMDVVRRHIENLRGRIEIRSTPGQGSTFLLKLPLTLAIIDGLVVGVGRERYIVPLFAVREMFRPTKDHIWTVQQRGEMALVRGTLLPILRLHRRFNVEPRSEDPLQSVLVVAEVEGQKWCLMVDELIGKQEVVIKSLGETFRGISGVAGGAILGDGRVGLILDLDRLFKGDAK
jgi:two-component system chemotaxis sensor kinase CheA